jgi:MbtH protein
VFLDAFVDLAKGRTMAWNDEDDTTVYCVVVNGEGQYSIWPAYKDRPEGWQAVGTTGGKQACLDQIKEIWTDMRPLSLRRRMETAVLPVGPDEDAA